MYKHPREHWLRALSKAKTMDENAGPLEYQLRNAIRDQLFEVMVQLVEQGANVNAFYVGKYRPICYSVDGDDQIPIKFSIFLVEHGAHVNVRNNHGFTPLHHASRGPKNNVAIIKYLIEHGADVNARSNTGITPMFHVRNVQNARILVEHGAIINDTDSRRETPLHHASKYVDEIQVKIFIELGMDINARENNGNTPLHEICPSTPQENLYVWGPRYYREKVRITKYLVGHGANISAKNNNGETPLQMARRLRGPDDEITAYIAKVVKNKFKTSCSKVIQNGYERKMYYTMYSYLPLPMDIIRRIAEESTHYPALYRI